MTRRSRSACQGRPEEDVSHADRRCLSCFIVASIRREVDVQAPADRVCAAIRTTDLGEMPLLCVLRPPTGWCGRWQDRCIGQVPPPLSLFELRRFGIVVLAECPTCGVALGAIVRPWSIRPSLQATSSDRFSLPGAAGFVKAAAAFEVAPGAKGRTRLIGEVRLLPIDSPGSVAFASDGRLGSIWSVSRSARC